MDLFSILLTALGLSADCFAVSLSGSISMKPVRFIQVLRTALVFGFFQMLMPILGFVGGRAIVDMISAYDHWLAFSLLAIVGGRMVWSSLHDANGRGEDVDISRGFLLLTLAVATSIDALAVGLSFALLHTDIVRASVLIGMVAFLVTGAGFVLGRKAGVLLGKWAKMSGGVVLIGIGVRILVAHLL